MIGKNRLGICYKLDIPLLPVMYWIAKCFHKVSKVTWGSPSALIQLHWQDILYGGKNSQWYIFMKGLFWSIHEFKFSQITTIYCPRPILVNITSPVEPGL